MFSFVSFDLETTGLSPDNNEIIEIGAWKIKNGVVVGKFCTLVKPLCRISGEIERLTGITNEDVADADTIDEVIHEFFAFCEDLPLLGYNLPFDYGFICEKGRRCGLDFSLNRSRCGIDVLKLCKRYIKSLDSYTLQSVASHFNISLDSARQGFHRAGYDAYITKLVYDRFIYVNEALPGVRVPYILDSDTKLYGKAVNHGTLSFD